MTIEVTEIRNIPTTNSSLQDLYVPTQGIAGGTNSTGKMLLNVPTTDRYADSNNGSDTAGDGTYFNPWATITYSLSQITDASITKIYALNCFGEFNETTLSLKSYINLFGNFSILNLSGNITLDSSWVSDGGAAQISDFAEIQIGGVSIDLSSKGHAAIYFNNMYILSTQTWSFTGTQESFVSLIDIYTQDNMTPININFTNIKSEIVSSLVNSWVYTNSLANNVITTDLHNTHFLGNISVTASNSTAGIGVIQTGGITMARALNAVSGNGTVEWFVSGEFDDGQTTLNGTGATIITTGLSQDPIFQNGATYEENVILITDSHFIKYTPTPINYVPIDASVQGQIIGIDNSLGALNSIGSTQLYKYVDSFAGSDTSGNGSIKVPWQTITHALSSITDASSSKVYNLNCTGIFNEASLNLKGYININGNNSILNLLGNIGIDSSWAANQISFVSNFSQVNFAISGAGVSVDFTSLGSSALYFSNINVSSASQTWTFSGTQSSFFGLNSIYTQNSVMPINLVVNSSKASVVNSLNQNFTCTNTISNNNLTIELKSTDILGTIQVTSNAGGSANITVVQEGGITNTRQLTSTAGVVEWVASGEFDDGQTTFSGVSAFLVTDGLRQEPIYTNGATYANNLILNRESHFLKYLPTPVNYTPVDSSVQGQIQGIDTKLGSITSGSLTYLGLWNANTNSPTITSSSGAAGNFYIVGTSGATTINGNSTWYQNDWIYFTGTVWERINLTTFNILIATLINTNNINAQTPASVMSVGSNLTAALAIGSNNSGQETNFISPVIRFQGIANSGTILVANGITYGPLSAPTTNGQVLAANLSDAQQMQWSNPGSFNIAAPSMNTSQRNTINQIGTIIYNTDNNQLEALNNSAWVIIG